MESTENSEAQGRGVIMNSLAPHVSGKTATTYSWR